MKSTQTLSCVRGNQYIYLLWKLQIICTSVTYEISFVIQLFTFCVQQPDCLKVWHRPLIPTVMSLIQWDLHTNFWVKSNLSPLPKIKLWEHEKYYGLPWFGICFKLSLPFANHCVGASISEMDILPLCRVAKVRKFNTDHAWRHYIHIILCFAIVSIKTDALKLMYHTSILSA